MVASFAWTWCLKNPLNQIPYSISNAPMTVFNTILQILKVVSPTSLLIARKGNLGSNRSIENRTRS